MALSSMITLCIIGMVFKDVIALPCLSIESKTKLQATRKALTVLQSSIDSRITNLQNDMKNRIKKLDYDMGSLVSDFEKKQWKKYNGHCYYYGSEKLTWFESEQRCIHIGGHLAKIDDAAENKWILDNRTYKLDVWMGLTDLEEGEFRWIYDQTIAKYKPWYSGWGSKGTRNNCGLIFSNNTKPYTWLDVDCKRNFVYVCESHFCY
ncbi:perlucin-like protein [Mytilus trossulus]|uniref:perlucin-like protein n=1 Tax=Mytilus trossulus TaxID=6551 RepID=UPI0030062B48